jgi:inner membrane transporter RhtA
MSKAGARPYRTVGAVAPLMGSMVSLCVGTSFAKTLFPVAGAAGITALRLGLSMLLIAAIQRPWRWRIDRAAGLAALRYGIVLGLMNLSFYEAVARLPLGIAIAIEFLGPLGVAIVGSVRRIDFLWIICAGVGVAILVLPRSGTPSLDLIGVFFALVAALFWALYIVWGRAATRVLHETQVVCLGLIAAALIAVPVGVASAGAVLFEPRVLATGSVVAILCSALPYSLEMVALKRLPGHVFGVLVSLEPAIGAVAAFAILGERLVGLQWLAIGAIMLASCGCTISHVRESRVPLP